MLKSPSKMKLTASMLALLLAGSAVHANEPAHGEAPAHGAEAHDAHATPADEGKVIKTRALPKDFLVPSTLWDKILGIEPAAADAHGAPAAGGGHGAPAADAHGGGGGSTPTEPGEITTSNILYSSIKVVLTEKNPGVLKEPIITFDFPKGGGDIDLSEWTTKQPGGLFVKFILPVENPPGLEVLHFSKTRKRKVEDRIYGGGCRSFYRITNQLQKLGDKRGIPLNTTRSFHVSTMGGHFIFSWPEGDTTQVTQVNFTSSRDPELFCQSMAQAKEAVPASGHSNTEKETEH